MHKALQKVCTQETQVLFKRLMASQSKSTVAVVSSNKNTVVLQKQLGTQVT